MEKCCGEASGSGGGREAEDSARKAAAVSSSKQAGVRNRRQWHSSGCFRRLSCCSSGEVSTAAGVEQLRQELGEPWRSSTAEVAAHIWLHQNCRLRWLALAMYQLSASDVHRPAAAHASHRTAQPPQPAPPCIQPAALPRFPHPCDPSPPATRPPPHPPVRPQHVCEYACSEEVPEPVAMGGSGFSVAFDPLDGSSIVDTNFAVGTIFGVWPGANLVGITGRQQVAAGMAIYGPRTVLCIALKDAPGCHEFLLQDDGKWLHVKETFEIGEGKLFSPGNLRATFDNPAYERLMSFYLGEKYTLRYTGGMVPDVFQVRARAPHPPVVWLGCVCVSECPCVCGGWGAEQPCGSGNWMTRVQRKLGSCEPLGCGLVVVRDGRRGAPCFRAVRAPLH